MYFWGFKLFAATPSFGKVIPLPRGYKRPTRRAMKSPERFPNVRTRAREYTVGASANGNFNLIPPFPPRPNRSMGGSDKSFPLRWKNVEYRCTSMLRLPPHGGDRWSTRFDRVEVSKK